MNYGTFGSGFLQGMAATTGMINGIRRTNMLEDAQKYNQARLQRIDAQNERAFGLQQQLSNKRLELLDNQLRQQNLGQMALTFHSMFIDPKTGSLRKVDLNNPKDAAMYQLFVKNAANKIPGLKEFGAIHPTVNPQEPYAGVVTNPDGSVTPALNTKQGEIVPMTEKRTDDPNDKVIQTDPNSLLYIIGKELSPYMPQQAQGLQGKDRYMTVDGKIFDTATQKFIAAPGGGVNPKDRYITVDGKIFDTATQKYITDGSGAGGVNPKDRYMTNGKGLIFDRSTGQWITPPKGQNTPSLKDVVGLVHNLPEGTQIEPGSPLAQNLQGAGVGLEPVPGWQPANANDLPPETIDPNAIGVVEPEAPLQITGGHANDQQAMIDYYTKIVGDPAIAQQIVNGTLKPKLVPAAGLNGSNQMVLTDAASTPLVTYQQNPKTGQWVRIDNNNPNSTSPNPSGQSPQSYNSVTTWDAFNKQYQ